MAGIIYRRKHERLVARLTPRSRGAHICVSYGVRDGRFRVVVVVWVVIVLMVISCVTFSAGRVGGEEETTPQPLCCLQIMGGGDNCLLAWTTG